MARQASRPQPVPAVLAYGDAYLLRLAREHRSLEHFAAATHDEIDKRRDLILAVFTERNLTRLDVGEFSIIRTGRDRIDIA